MWLNDGHMRHRTDIFTYRLAGETCVRKAYFPNDGAFAFEKTDPVGERGV
jgi:hypothetical protein